MLRDLLLFIKYPYTAGVIATIWICSAVLMAINHEVDGLRIVIIDMFVSVIIAIIGFGGKED